MTVTGAGSSWIGAKRINVGHLRQRDAEHHRRRHRLRDQGLWRHRQWRGATGAVAVDGTGSAWTGITTLNVGYEGNGTLNVTNGGAVSDSGAAYIGFSPSTNATVSGAKSTWTNGPITSDSGNGTSRHRPLTAAAAASSGSGNVHGNGTLTCRSERSGAVSSSGGSIGALIRLDGRGYGRRGWLDVDQRFGPLRRQFRQRDAERHQRRSRLDRRHNLCRLRRRFHGGDQFRRNGGTLTTWSLAASSSQLTGTGTINARGLVSDVNLVFDSAASLKQTLTFNNQPGQNITVNLDMASARAPTAPSAPAGKATVVDDPRRGHGQLPSRLHRLRQQLDGRWRRSRNRSKWTNSWNLSVGNSGSGTFTVAGGGSVSSGGTLYVGNSGSGTLTVASGGSLSSGGDATYRRQFRINGHRDHYRGRLDLEQRRPPLRRFVGQRNAEHYQRRCRQRWPLLGLHRLRIRLDGRRYGRRSRLDLDQQRQPCTWATPAPGR